MPQFEVTPDEGKDFAKVFPYRDPVIKGDFTRLKRGTVVDGHLNSTRNVVILEGMSWDEKDPPYGMYAKDMTLIPDDTTPPPDNPDVIIWDAHTLKLVDMITGAEFINNNPVAVERVEG